MKNKIYSFGVLSAVVLCVFASTFDVEAQTPRRKRKAKPQRIAPAPPIVSRNAPYLDGNQIVLGEALQQTDANPGDSNQPTAPAPVEENNTEVNSRIIELNARIKSLEAGNRDNYDKKQKRLAMNLDILTKAEQRAESLRKQLYEMVEKEASVRTRLEQISFDARPEMIERSTAFSGSLRPEELRDQRKKSLEAEKRNLESLLTQIQTSRASLEENVQKADFLVEKVRLKLDKEIDDALVEEKEDQ
jgi:hypothetical protein